MLVKTKLSGIFPALKIDHEMNRLGITKITANVQQVLVL